MALVALAAVAETVRRQAVLGVVLALAAFAAAVAAAASGQGGLLAGGVAALALCVALTALGQRVWRLLDDA